MSSICLVYLQTVLCTLIFSVSLGAQTTVITFNLRSPETATYLDGVKTGGLEVAGLVATFTSLPGATTASLFNQTASRFGINTLGSSDDSPSLIDAANGISEYLSDIFSENVLLVNTAVPLTVKKTGLIQP